jgi:hypothetical protein
VAVPGSVTPLCQQLEAEREFLYIGLFNPSIWHCLLSQINGLFNPFIWLCLLSQINGLFNPFICEWHTSVLTESFAGNLGTWWVLAALVFSSIGKEQDSLNSLNIKS